ncbi:MAG TPA: hypothetical protein PLN21_00400 [Gemmatales bacterium]|nr:hypothetical protein [Gemmatales bacterium]
MVPALTTLLQQVERKVQQTQRRQVWQRTLLALPFNMTVALLIGTICVIVLPLVGIPLSGWELAIVTVIILAELLSTLAIAWVSRPTRQDAAYSLDQAFGLEERIVTLTTLRSDQHETEAAQLLARQMQERVAKIEVAQQFLYTLPRRSWYAPLGATLALIVALFFPAAGLFSTATKANEKNGNKETKAAEQKQIDITSFKQANEERKKRLKEIGSADLNEMQKEIDQLLQKLEKTQEGSAEAKMSLEDVTRLTEKVRQQETAKEKIDEIKKQLKIELGDKLGGDKGPAEEFTKALTKADFDKAKKEMQKLAEKMKNGEMSKEEMKDLAKQMNNLKDKLEQIAQQKEKLEALEKSNLDPETKAKEKEKIEKEMEKLKDIADLAQQMKDAAEQLQKDPDAAREALEKMAEELGKMEMTEEELGELKLTEGDLQDLKNAIAGMKGKGGKKGKKDSWDKGDGSDDEKGDGQGDKQGQGGGKQDGETEGGARDEKIDDTKAEDTNTKTKSSNNGKLTVVGEGPKQGKPGKDQVKERIVLSSADLDQAKQQASEALKQQKISQTQKNVVTDFYKNLAPGK